eukprot:4432722-Alexandrium_andersonii.AAC.1
MATSGAVRSSPGEEYVVGVVSHPPAHAVSAPRPERQARALMLSAFCVGRFRRVPSRRRGTSFARLFSALGLFARPATVR